MLNCPYIRCKNLLIKSVTLSLCVLEKLYLLPNTLIILLMNFPTFLKVYF